MSDSLHVLISGFLQCRRLDHPLCARWQMLVSTNCPGVCYNVTACRGVHPPTAIANQETLCNNTIIKDRTIPQMCRYTTLWNVNVRATIENKTCVTHFKKLTTGNNVFIVLVITCRIVQFLHQYSMCPPCCWTTQSWNVFLQKSSCFLLFLLGHWHFTWGVMGSLVILILHIFSPDSDNEKSLKIDQYLTKSYSIQKCVNSGATL